MEFNDQLNCNINLIALGQLMEVNIIPVEDRAKIRRRFCHHPDSHTRQFTS
jgi:hypothetical protein